MASPNHYGTVNDGSRGEISNNSGYRLLEDASPVVKRNPSNTSNINQYLDRQILNKGTDEELVSEYVTNLHDLHRPDKYTPKNP